MEFKSENSNLKLEEIKLIAEKTNPVLKFVDKKFLSVNYDQIKGFKIVSWRPITYIIYLIGLMIGLCYFIKTSEVLENGYYVLIENSIEGRIILAIMGVLIIGYGYYFNSKFGNLNTLNIKYFEGKIRTSQIFTSTSKEELNIIQNEIQTRIK